LWTNIWIARITNKRKYKKETMKTETKRRKEEINKDENLRVEKRETKQC
jgi:hypothetical protein